MTVALRAIPSGLYLDVGYGWHPSRQTRVFADAETAWQFAKDTFVRCGGGALTDEELRSAMEVVPWP